VLETVVAAMLRAPNDALLQQHGAWALHAAAATNSLIVGADADWRAMILALLDAMRAHAVDAETLHVCLVTLSSISVEDDLERLAGSMGAHSAILEVFASHASDEEMIEAALTLMRNLSLMPEGKLAVGLCGSVEAVRVLTRHAHSERVAARACAALAALVLDSTNEAVAGHCGALPAIITALRTHGRSSRELTAYSCLALARGTVLAKNEVIAGDAGAIPALVAVTEDPTTDAEVMESALDSLRNLSAYGLNKERILRAHALPAVVMAMRRSVASAEVQVAGCHALAYACCNNPEGDFHACVACCSAAADADARGGHGRALVMCRTATPEHTCATGAGSARPVVSIRMWSNLTGRSWNFFSTRICRHEARQPASFQPQSPGQGQGFAGSTRGARCAPDHPARCSKYSQIVHLHNVLRRLHGQQRVVDANLQAPVAVMCGGGQQQAACSWRVTATCARLAKLVLDDGDLEIVGRVIIQDGVDKGGLPASAARHGGGA
jgi:hypothetical protein